MGSRPDASERPTEPPDTPENRSNVCATMQACERTIVPSPATFTI